MEGGLWGFSDGVLEKERQRKRGLETERGRKR